MSHKLKDANDRKNRTCRGEEREGLVGGWGGGGEEGVKLGRGVVVRLFSVTEDRSNKIVT